MLRKIISTKILFLSLVLVSFSALAQQGNYVQRSVYSQQPQQQQNYNQQQYQQYNRPASSPSAAPTYTQQPASAQIRNLQPAQQYQPVAVQPVSAQPVNVQPLQAQPATVQPSSNQQPVTPATTVESESTKTDKKSEESSAQEPSDEQSYLEQDSEQDETTNIKSNFNSQSKSKDGKELVIIDNKNLPWISEDEPKKSDNNLVRIKFPKDSELPVNDDIIAVKAMLKLVEQEKISNLLVKSYASSQNDDTKEKQTAIRRTLALVKFITENGFPQQKIRTKIFSSKDNKSGFDYIDIDKN